MAIPRFFRPFLQPIAVFTGAKSFEDNVFLGSAFLNRLGLHAARVSLAHRLATSRRERLRSGLDAEHREQFDANGFVSIPNVLPRDEFESLMRELDAYRGPVLSKDEGASTLRKVSLDARALAALPSTSAVVKSPSVRGVIDYVGARASTPKWFLQSVHQRPLKGGEPDPQTKLHADTFHPTVKAWLFLSDVGPEDGAFTFVPGSHRLTRERLDWERAMSLVARNSPHEMTREGSFRVDESELPSLRLGAPRPVAVRANTLVVADTFGFHARGVASRDSDRYEIWGIGPRNPFLPFTFLDRAAAAIGGVPRGADHWTVHEDAPFFLR